VAYLFKLPTPTVWSPKGLRYSAASGTDFVGFLLDGSGRVIAEEVKACSTKARFNLREVEPHQRDMLDRVHAAGGLALLTLVWGKDRAVCVLPWAAVREKVSLADDEIRAWAEEPETFLGRHIRP